MALAERVFGLETEYAINFYPKAGSRTPTAEVIVQALHAVLSRDFGISNSFFLVTGAKFLHDVGHAEWALPECSTARELASYDKAADHLLAQILPETERKLAQDGYLGSLLVAKNNVDSAGNTYGCHENYLMLRNTELLIGDQFLHYLARCLIPFLVTRQIFTGAGRFVPAHLSRVQRPVFEISQRAAFINSIVSKDTIREKPIINLGREGEPLATENYRRLHLILGDANLSGWTTWIKLGTTGIVLRMIEDIFFSDMPLLQDPVMALQEISRDSTCSVAVPLKNGGEMSAIDIQWYYYERANTYLSHFDCSDEEDALMEAWQQALHDLERDPMRLRDRVDWVMKKRLLDNYLEQSGISWNNLPADKSTIDTLQARDLRYHDVSRDGHFNHLCYPDTLITEAEIHYAQRNPPQYTRAMVRGGAIKQARQNNKPVKVDNWQEVEISGKKISLPDPLDFDPPQYFDYSPFDKAWWSISSTHADPLMRVRFVKHLTWRKEAEALTILIDRAQNDESEQVRRAAVEALGYRADKTTTNALIECLSDESFLVRWAAEEALERVSRGVPVQPPNVAALGPDNRELPFRIISQQQ